MFSSQGYADRHEKQASYRAPATAIFSGNGQGGRLLRFRSRASQASRVWRQRAIRVAAGAGSVVAVGAGVAGQAFLLSPCSRGLLDIRRRSAALHSMTSSNCRPNCTEGSKKPLIASNGTERRSGTPPNERPTSNPSSLTFRSQNCAAG